MGMDTATSYVSEGNNRESAIRWLIINFGLTRDEAAHAVYLADVGGGYHKDDGDRFAIEAVPTRHYDHDGNSICLYDITG